MLQNGLTNGQCSRSSSWGIELLLIDAILQSDFVDHHELEQLVAQVLAVR
jgi:hypothetical protein